MKRLVARFGKLITASFIVMAIGIVVFLLVIPLYAYFEIDTDIIGLIIFTTGLAICIIGIIRRKNLHGWKFVVLAILIVVLCLPLLLLIFSTIYYLITGNPM
jgi:uncharacterized RDD family membrane protein YckC